MVFLARTSRAASLAALLMAGGVSAGDDRAPTFSVPLSGGRLEVRDVLARAAERLGIEDLAPLEAMTWSIDVQSLAGRLQVTALERLTGRALDIDVHADRVDVRIDQPRLVDLLKRTDRTTQRWLADFAKFDAQREIGRYGLTFVTADDARAPATALSDKMKQRVVVLVHGLDDPGFMWADFVPALHEAGYTVARFEYPNDGPISDGADLLAEGLRNAKQAGIERLDIVAHSMGGLVTRDVLTRAAFYNGDGQGGPADEDGERRFPAVDRFIMCGTPHHGSHMARLRGVIELREHLATAIATGQDFSDLAAIDGNGEAGIDLLPDSEFLRRLNARPLPAHTRMTIIAARLSPIDGDDVQSTVSRLKKLAISDDAPEWLREAAGGAVAQFIEKQADEAVDALGDGCVSMESAKLAGVEDVVVVRASHLGMIINLGGGSDRPAAIPIVLERLGTQPQMNTDAHESD
jgi:pimeloyl-ACP methyl ester carboxylesterase